MDVLFENHYTRDIEWAKDACGYALFRRPILIICYAVLILYMLLGVFELFVSGAVFWECFLLPLLWGGVAAFSYRKHVNTTLSRDRELHGKAIEVTVSVGEDGIRQTQSTGAEFQLHYSDVKKVVQTKRFIYLWSKTNMLYSLKRDGFLHGTADGFLYFLKSKGLKVK